MKKIKLTKKQIENIIQEEAIPVGLNITMGVHKQDGKENQGYYKDFGKKMDDYYKPLSDTEKENSDSVMKYSYDKDSDEYHNEYEILNGQEMLRYMNDPDERFKDRAEKAIAGSAEMGNNPEWANVVTADQAGFTGPDFGKQLVARIKSREEKYKEEDKLEKYDGMGDVAIPGAGKGEQRKLAIAENKYNSKNKKTMKRLRFKKPFNGVENALNLIPESYKVDNKTFQMTDGNENYEIRWEGSINEGKASILKASDKNLMNEDMQRMKELFNFKSQDTLGNLKGSERLNENKQFDAIWDKTKNINEMTGGFGFTGEGNLEGNTPMIDEEEKVEEAAKPDFPDLDGDGDKTEPITKAAKDKKEKEESGIEEGEMHEEEKKGKVINILKQLPKDHKMSEKEKEAIEKALEIMKKMNSEDIVNEVVKKKVNEEELQINKNNWSGEDATIDVNYETNEFEIPNVGTFKLEFYEDESGENAKVYLDGELDEDLKLTKFRNEWIAGTYNWEITREHKNPYIALAQLAYNIF